ncbi:tetratricopeptide repeat protein [Cognatazoarcus halotolerans]|uniref:hypothetical protein n=1 Tax=Cognatazoarcus halotolerans TaxID=2686016 RepID=UPI00135C62D7|nr:hypothetical protein [Cognatazoarcus halotolerans]
MTGIFSNRTKQPDPTSCFVMMPFAENFNAIYRLIQRVCTDQGLKCARADEDVTPGKITGKIYDMVAASGIIIVDMTGRNPNVFYELGLAHAISDNVILLTQFPDDVPFDLQDFMHIRYSNSFDGAEKLSIDLSKVLSTILSSADLRIPPDDERRKRNAVVPDQYPVEEFDLGLAHLQAEMSRVGNDMHKAAEWLQRALAAAKAGGGDANEIGNCAIEAESCKFYDLAEELYRIAIERDPLHVNNRQSYVSFILDHRTADQKKVEIAGSMLSELEGTTERQERTRGLKAQYLTTAQNKADGQLNLDEIIADVVGDGEFDSLVQAAPALLVLQKAGKYDEMKALIDNLRSKIDGDETRALDRVLADAFAGSGNEKLRSEAITIYEKLLQAPDEESVNVKHNLATLLYSRGREAANGRVYELWKEAYNERPSDASIRKAFARYLMRHDRKADAASVLNGDPIG